MFNVAERPQRSPKVTGGEDLTSSGDERFTWGQGSVGWARASLARTSKGSSSSNVRPGLTIKLKAGRTSYCTTAPSVLWACSLVAEAVAAQSRESPPAQIAHRQPLRFIEAPASNRPSFLTNRARTAPATGSSAGVLGKRGQCPLLARRVPCWTILGLRAKPCPRRQFQIPFDPGVQ